MNLVQMGCRDEWRENIKCVQHVPESFGFKATGAVPFRASGGLISSLSVGLRSVHPGALSGLCSKANATGTGG